MENALGGAAEEQPRPATTRSACSSRAASASATEASPRSTAAVVSIPDAASTARSASSRRVAPVSTASQSGRIAAGASGSERTGGAITACTRCRRSGRPVAAASLRTASSASRDAGEKSTAATTDRPSPGAWPARATRTGIGASRRMRSATLPTIARRTADSPRSPATTRSTPRRAASSQTTIGARPARHTHSTATPRAAARATKASRRPVPARTSIDSISRPTPSGVGSIAWIATTSAPAGAASRTAHSNALADGALKSIATAIEDSRRPSPSGLRRLSATRRSVSAGSTPIAMRPSSPPWPSPPASAPRPPVHRTPRSSFAPFVRSRMISPPSRALRRESSLTRHAARAHGKVPRTRAGRRANRGRLPVDAGTADASHAARTNDAGRGAR